MGVGMVTVPFPPTLQDLRAACGRPSAAAHALYFVGGRRSGSPPLILLNCDLACKEWAERYPLVLDAVWVLQDEAAAEAARDAVALASVLDPGASSSSSVVTVRTREATTSLSVSDRKHVVTGAEYAIRVTAHPPTLVWAQTRLRPHELVQWCPSRLAAADEPAPPPVLRLLSLDFVEQVALESTRDLSWVPTRCSGHSPVLYRSDGKRAILRDVADLEAALAEASPFPPTIAHYTVFRHRANARYTVTVDVRCGGSWYREHFQLAGRLRRATLTALVLDAFWVGPEAVEEDIQFYFLIGDRTLNLLDSDGFFEDRVRTGCPLVVHLSTAAAGSVRTLSLFNIHEQEHKVEVDLDGSGLVAYLQDSAQRAFGWSPKQRVLLYAFDDKRVIVDGEDLLDVVLSDPSPPTRLVAITPSDLEALHPLRHLFRYHLASLGSRALKGTMRILRGFQDPDGDRKALRALFSMGLSVPLLESCLPYRFEVEACVRTCAWRVTNRSGFTWDAKDLWLCDAQTGHRVLPVTGFEHDMQLCIPVPGVPDHCTWLMLYQGDTPLAAPGTGIGAPLPALSTHRYRSALNDEWEYARQCFGGPDVPNALLAGFWKVMYVPEKRLAYARQPLVAAVFPTLGAASADPDIRVEEVVCPNTLTVAELGCGHSWDTVPPTWQLYYRDSGAPAPQVFPPRCEVMLGSEWTPCLAVGQTASVKRRRRPAAPPPPATPLSSADLKQQCADLGAVYGDVVLRDVLAQFLKQGTNPLVTAAIPGLADLAGLHPQEQVARLPYGVRVGRYVAGYVLVANTGTIPFPPFACLRWGDGVHVPLKEPNLRPGFGAAVDFAEKTLPASFTLAAYTTSSGWLTFAHDNAPKSRHLFFEEDDDDDDDEEEDRNDPRAQEGEAKEAEVQEAGVQEAGVQEAGVQEAEVLEDPVTEVVKDSVVKDPVVQDPVVEFSEEPVVEDPVVEFSEDPVVEDPAAALDDWKAELSLLAALGFNDRRQCTDALRYFQGDVGRCVHFLSGFPV